MFGRSIHEACPMSSFSKVYVDNTLHKEVRTFCWISFSIWSHDKGFSALIHSLILQIKRLQLGNYLSLISVDPSLCWVVKITDSYILHITFSFGVNSIRKFGFFYVKKLSSLFISAVLVCLLKRNGDLVVKKCASQPRDHGFKPCSGLDHFPHMTPALVGSRELIRKWLI
jgi:hypothetical protein